MSAKKATAEVEVSSAALELDGKAHKVTTIRLTEREHAQVEMFAEAMGGLSMTEFVGRAVRVYLSACTKDPKIKKEIQREIARRQQALNAFADQVLGGDADDE